MSRNSVLASLSIALAATAALPAHADMMFNRVASFAVAGNLPAGAIGFVDITDPRNPKALGSVKADGEPTSVTVAGGKILAGVNTSKSKADPAGKLLVLDLASKAIENSCDLGGQPDSVALSKDGKFLAVAIENERDEEVNDGEIPNCRAAI